MATLRSIVFAAGFGVLGLTCIAAAAPPVDGRPTFSVADSALGHPVSVIVYGDMRFHDPADTTAANPAARKELVEQIAKEKPSAVQLTGDVPYRGVSPADYDRYREESIPWKLAGLRIYPALGNHEFAVSKGSPEDQGAALNEEQALQNWWGAFPELRDKRWYSVALGSRIALIQLDSMSPLTDGSDQRLWLDAQLKALPRSVDFVLIGLHHPPVADIQTRIEVDHNPRPNEIALRDYLTSVQPALHAQIVVTAGHIHNYERAEVGGITYLVSGGGGARPYEVDRTAQDLYQDKSFPNFHYIRFDLEKTDLKATMFRLEDPAAPKPVWEQKDHFVVRKR